MNMEAILAVIFITTQVVVMTVRIASIFVSSAAVRMYYMQRHVHVFSEGNKLCK